MLSKEGRIVLCNNVKNGLISKYTTAAMRIRFRCVGLQVSSIEQARWGIHLLKPLVNASVCWTMLRVSPAAFAILLDQPRNGGARSASITKSMAI